MMSFQRITAVAVALSLAACASQPPVRVALPGPTRAHEVAGMAGGGTLVVRPVTLPGYIDRYAVVVDRSESRLTVSEEAEWAERLPAAVTRVLRDALSDRLGASRILMRGDRRMPDAELIIEFTKLDPSERALQLDARWTFVCRSREASPHAGRTEFSVALDSATPHAVAAATSRALGEFADVLAANAQACPH